MAAEENVGGGRGQVGGDLNGWVRWGLYRCIGVCVYVGRCGGSGIGLGQQAQAERVHRG